MKSKAINYAGEIVSPPQPLTWRQMEPGLPPREYCGRISAVDLAEGPTREWLLHPEWSLKPHDAIGAIPRPAKCHFVKGEEIKIARNLLSRSLVEPVELEAVPVVNGQLITNSTFGVGKGKFLSSSSREEVLRWILALTTSNSIMIPFAGDIRGLPMPTQWKQTILESDEIAVWNFEDLSGCFYLFRFPPGWSRIFVLNHMF